MLTDRLIPPGLDPPELAQARAIVSVAGVIMAISGACLLLLLGLGAYRLIPWLLVVCIPYSAALALLRINIRAAAVAVVLANLGSTVALAIIFGPQTRVETFLFASILLPFNLLPPSDKRVRSVLVALVVLALVVLVARPLDHSLVDLGLDGIELTLFQTFVIVAALMDLINRVATLDRGYHDSTAALARSERRVRLALEVSGQGAWETDFRRRISRFDEVSGRILGLEPGTYPVGHVGPESNMVDEHGRRLDQVVSEQLATPRFEVVGRHRERELWVRVTGVVLGRDAHGHPTHVIGTVQDITAIVLERARLAEARRQAEAAARAKAAFLANMSHEIRTPMNGIVGAASLLSYSEVSPEQRELIDAITTSGEALRSIIDDVLDYSKIDAGELTLGPEPTNIRDLVEEATAVLAQQADSKDLELVCDVTPDVPWLVRSDPGRVRQVVLNLVGNAVKFTGHGYVNVRVTTRCDTEHEWLHIAIEDTGIGIAAEHLEQLFEPFKQADESTTRNFGGTGLGLALSRRLVELMGGTIGVESRKGHGSRFWFELPVVDPQPREVPLLASGRRVLLDLASPRVSQALRHAVEAEGATCHPLETAPPEFAPHFVLTDEPRRYDTMSGVVAVMGWTRFITAQTYPRLPVPFTRGHIAQVFAPDQQRHATQALPPLHGRVLLAEDNPVNRMLVERLLAKLGVAVDAVEDGRAAVERVREHDYGLVLMDCQMPVMDGYEASRRIRALPTGRRVPICALTANAFEEDAQACRDAGMDDYVAKPVRADTLARVLARWLDAAPSSTPGSKGPEHDGITGDASEPVPIATAS